MARWKSTKFTWWPAQGPAGTSGQKGRLGPCRKLASALGRGTLEKDKPPILGLIQRSGQVVLHMLANVQQRTIKPIITAAVTPGTLVHTDEYAIHARLPSWGYEHNTVCHVHGEYARDEDGNGFCKVHVNTMEGFWSLLRSWLRPHRGISQDKLPLYLNFFPFMHNARRRGKALLGTLVAALVAEPRPTTPEPDKSLVINCSMILGRASNRCQRLTNWHKLPADVGTTFQARRREELTCRCYCVGMPRDATS